MKIFRKLFKKLGPGFVTGSSDDDPSGIATYSAAGAQFNLKLLWPSLFTLPLIVAVQEMCARVGLASGRGLGQVLKMVFGKKVIFPAIFLLAIANIFNVGADLSMMADSLKLLAPALPLWPLIILVAAVSVVLEVFVSYKTYFHFLKWLCLSLLAYWLTAILVVTDWTRVIGNLFVIHWIWEKEYLLMLMAFLGTTISPYLFFWQSSGEVEEEIDKGRGTIKQRKGVTKKELSAMRFDVWLGMLFSNLTTFFIVVTAAATLNKHGIFKIETAAQAASALRPLAGDLTYFLFTLGIVGTGLLAIPVLAGSVSYAISEILNFKEGLFLNWRKAKGFYAIMALAVFLGVGVNFLGLKPITALIYAAVLNGLTAPVFIYLIIKAANSRKIMGNLVNGWVSNLLSWIAFVIMAGTGLALVISFFL